VLSTVRPPSIIGLHTAALDRHKLVTLIAGSISKQRRLLFAGDDDEVFMTRSLDGTQKTTEQNLILRSGKSEAATTNNKKLRSIQLKLTGQRESIARLLCDSRAT